VVVATDDVGDAHVVVVDHHRQHVGRRPVGAQQDEIVELGIGDRDAALDEVVDCRLALARGFQADDGGSAFGPRIGAVAPFALEPERPPLGLRPLAPGLQFLGRQIAAVGGAALDQLVRDLGVARLILRLEMDLLVPVEPEPGEPVEDHVDRFLGRARLVGVLDPEQRLAAVVAGVEPGEQPGAGVADVEEAGGRRREPRHH
jgi:hypothetical protein